MDERKFDRLSRAFGMAATRRAGIIAAVGALAGAGAALARRPGAPGGAGKPGGAGPCGNGSVEDNRCTRNGQCCTKYCAVDRCRCKPNWMACGEDGQCCSGSCIRGQCDGGCSVAGARCEETFNCCSGMSCTNGTCTKSGKASCGRRNCPGCCNGTMCRVGASKKACGANADICVACVGRSTCTGSTCGAEATATPRPTSTPAATATPTVVPTPTPNPACVVPGDGTLQAAIDNAPDGATVCLQAGTFSTTSASYVAVITKNLTLVGEGKARTFIDGNDTFGPTPSYAGIQIGAANYSSLITVNISDLTVRNARAKDGGAVLIYGRSGMSVSMADVTIKDCVNGSGIAQFTGANGKLTATFTRVSVTGNTTDPSTTRGGGMYLSGTVTLTDCDITDNTAITEGGGIASGPGAVIAMTGGSIARNTAKFFSPGVYGNGGGLMFYYGASSFTATNVSLVNNEAEGYGGLAHMEVVGNTLSLGGCTVTGNVGQTSCNCVSEQYVTCNASYCTSAAAALLSPRDTGMPTSLPEPLPGRMPDTRAALDGKVGSTYSSLKGY